MKKYTRLSCIKNSLRFISLTSVVNTKFILIIMLIKCIILIYFLIIFNRIYAKNVAPAIVIDDKIGENNPHIPDPQALPSFVEVTDKPNGSGKKGAIVMKNVNITYQLSNCNKTVADVEPAHWKPFVEIPKQNPGRYDHFNFDNNKHNREMMARMEKLFQSSECAICRACLDKFRISLKFKKQEKLYKRMSKKAKPNELKMNIKSADRSNFEAINGDPRKITNKREKREHTEKPKTPRRRKARRNRKSKKAGRSKKKSKSKSSAYNEVKEKRMETITSITKLRFENIKSEILQVNETERVVIPSAIKGLPDIVRNITNTCNLYQVTKLMSCASPEASKLQLESLRNTLLQTEKFNSNNEATEKYESVSKMPPEKAVTHTSTTTKSESSFDPKHEIDKIFIEEASKKDTTNYRGVFSHIL